MPTNDQNKKLLSEAYDNYAEEIYRFCFFRVHSKEIAEELVQDAFIKTWKYISDDKEIQNIRPFLYKISRNLVIDYYRKDGNKKKKEQWLEDATKETRNMEFLSYDQKEINDKKAMIDEVFDTLKMLPQTYQDILIMRYIEGMWPNEIAQVFNTNPKNISAKLNRAKKKLNNILKDINDKQWKQYNLHRQTKRY